MILTCPNCETRFNLNQALLGVGGKRVRCSECEEVWFQAPEPDDDDTPKKPQANIEIEFQDILTDKLEEDAEEAEEEEETAEEKDHNPEEERNVPMVREDTQSDTGQSRHGLYGMLAGIAVLALTLGGFFGLKMTLINAWQPMAAVYQAVGMDVPAPGEGLVFDKITATIQGHTLAVNGQIINLTSAEQQVPDLRLQLKDEKGNILQEWTDSLNDDTLAAENMLNFTLGFETENGAAADHIHIGFVLSDAVKNASEDADNTPAPHADDHAAPHGAGSH